MNYSFITHQTCYGLKISLKATLEICPFLIYKYGFKYLMTARLNQDNLEVYLFLILKKYLFLVYILIKLVIIFVITFAEICWDDAKLLWFQRSS